MTYKYFSKEKVYPGQKVNEPRFFVFFFIDKDCVYFMQENFTAYGFYFLSFDSERVW